MKHSNIAPCRGCMRWITAGAWACAAALLSMSGCNIIGPAYVLIHGPEKTPALFTLEKDRSTVIFIDDRANILSPRALRQTIAQTAQKALLENKTLTNVIDGRAAILAASEESSSELLDIATLGKRVGADIVIYATTLKFELSPDGQTFQPEARFNVKVLDVTKPQPRLWPAEREGYPLVVTGGPRAGTLPRTTSEVNKARQALADRAGVAIARLFFSYETHERAMESR